METRWGLFIIILVVFATGECYADSEQKLISSINKVFSSACPLEEEIEKKIYAMKEKSKI